VKYFNSLNESFPDFSLTIRRLLRDDPAFEELCDDFEDATNATNFWLSPPHRSEKRAREYRDLADEIAAEIDAALRIANQKQR
jgi:hypothetical protein